jgi:DNA-binding NarL/FixJ family response regulator
MNNMSNQKTSKVRLLIIDDDHRYRSQLCEMFQFLGYQVSAPAGKGEELIEAVKSEAKLFRAHVAIVDLRLRDDLLDQTDGFDLIASIRPARIIVFSAFADGPTTRRAFLDFQVEDIINKSAHPDLLITAVDKAAQKVSASHRGLDFGSRSKICQPEPIMRHMDLNHLPGTGAAELPDDLLAMLFPGEASLFLRPVETGPITSHPVSRGRTVIMTAQRSGKLQVEVVKLAPAEKICKEVKNYNEFIALNLGGHFHATLSCNDTFYELGGAVYTFLGHADENQKVSPMYTLAEVYLNNDKINLASPLRHFFETVWQGLYQKKETRQIRLIHAYEEFLDLQKRIEPLLEKFPSKDIRLPGLSFLLPNPFLFLSDQLNEKDESEVSEFAITHGDLHAGNLLIDNTNEHAWTIDFERTGYGPIYRDFVELEVDIATRLMKVPSTRASSFIEVAAALCAPIYTDEALYKTKNMKEETLRGIRLIACLRDLAKTVTGSFNAYEYGWGILIDSAFVASLEEQNTQRFHRAIILASVAAQALSGSGEFPPEHWKVSAFQPIHHKDSYII